MTRFVATRSALRACASIGLVVASSGCPIGDLQAGNKPDAAALAKDGGATEAKADASSSPYYPLNDSARWSFFDVSQALPAGAETAYSGAEFDGRYLYFVPYSGGDVLQYDTSMSFTDPSSWASYSFLPNVVAVAGPTFNSGAAAFLYRGGAYDGSRFVYFAPFNPNTYAVQYDTHQPFTSSAAWTVFNTATIDPNANYWGVTCDLRYAYFIPNTTTRVLAFDSQFANGGGFSADADGGASAAWISYDLAPGDAGAATVANAEGFWGGTFDGSYVYLVPYSGAVVERHTTEDPVTASDSYTGFDFVNAFINPNPPFYWGGAYDGQNVYLIPYQGSPPLLALYDTRSSNAFADSDAWTSFDLRRLFAPDGGSPSSVGLSPAFIGAAFDGKRLFLAPAGNLTTGAGASVGTTPAPVPVVAYDTTLPPVLVSSYSTYDPSVDNGAAHAFEGAAFDGQYVYFVPHGFGIVARFEAKNAPGPLSPTVYTGSWW